MVKKAAGYIRIPKKLFYSILVLVVGYLGYMALKPTSTPVDIGEITEGVFTKAIIDEGTTSFKKRYVISSPGDGIVPTINLEPGDPVKKGEVLFNYVWDYNLQVRSPVNGYILKVFEKDKRHVPKGTPILEVGDPSELEILSKILSEEVIEIKLSQKALITNWGQESPLEAKVTKIEPFAKEEISALGVKERRVQVHLTLTSDRKIWRGLGDNFRVEVTIVTEEKPNSRLLPVGALFSHNGKPSIYLIEGGRTKLTPVEIGNRNRDYVELLSDLPVGSKLVLYPGSGLKPDERVTQRPL